MGNPLKLEVELSAQQKQQGQLAASDSLERENADAPLLSSKARAEDSKQEDYLQQGRDEGKVARVNVEPPVLVSRNGDSPRVVKLSEDVKPLLMHSSSQNDIAGASKGNEIDSTSPSREEDITPEFTREMEIKCAPYVRHDTYGNFGGKEISVWEKVKLFIALVILVPIRMILILGILVTYYCICNICTIFRLPGEEEGQENYGHLTGLRRTVIVHSGRFLARCLLFVVGFYHIKVTHRTSDVMERLNLGVGERANEDNEGLLEASRRNAGAVVSNHISYLDILYHMSSSFPSFVAKRSVAKLPLVGLISKCMGCVYVQRESKSSNFKGVSGIVVQRLQAAHKDPAAPMLLLFPEGTTSNGEYLLPFKTGAFLAETPVQPVILKYPFTRFSPAWETITGARHVFLLLSQLVNHLEVVRLPVYYPSAKECSDPKAYANNVRTLMSVQGNLPISDVGLYEKRVYHAALAGKPLSSKAHKKLD